MFHFATIFSRVESIRVSFRLYPRQSWCCVRGNSQLGIIVLVFVFYRVEHIRVSITLSTGDVLRPRQFKEWDHHSVRAFSWINVLTKHITQLSRRYERATTCLLEEICHRELLPEQ